MVEKRQYSCGQVGGEAMQMQWWKGNTAVVVLKRKQYRCDGGEGKAIHLWWGWRRINTVVMVVQGRQYSWVVLEEK